MSEFQALLDSVDEIKRVRPGEVIKAKIIHIGRKHILFDVNGQFTGYVSGKDLQSSILDVSELKVGDEVEAMVKGEDRNTGLVILSFRKASQVQLIDRLGDYRENKITMTVMASEANKGGLLIDLDGMKGFIPVSQLSPMNYPRVEGADPERILEHLRGLIGKPLKVTVINVDFEGKKIIFSERATEAQKRQAALSKMKEGDVVEGVVSGILSYGLFVTFDGLEGLVHVSEVDWGHVSDLRRFAKIGDKIKVQIIGLNIDKISLSIKRLKPNPWDEMAKKFNIGDVMNAPVTKISKFGIFLQLDGGVNGLIHLSEVEDKVLENIEDHIRINDKVKARIIALDAKEKRIGLSIKALDETYFQKIIKGEEKTEKAPIEKKEAPKAVEKKEAPKAAEKK